MSSSENFYKLNSPCKKHLGQDAECLQPPEAPVDEVPQAAVSDSITESGQRGMFQFSCRSRATGQVTDEIFAMLFFLSFFIFYFHSFLVVPDKVLSAESP